MGDRRTADLHRQTAGVSLLKRGLLGRPLATAEGRQQRLRKLVALPIFSADVAVAYAKSLHPEHLVAVTVATDDVDPDAARAAWASHRFGVPLEVLESPYRDLTEPVLAYLDELDRRWADDTISVIIPEVVVHRWFQHLLHNQSGLALKARLLYRENTVVVSVPWHFDPEQKRVHVPGGIVTAGAGTAGVGGGEGDGDRPVEGGGSAGEQAPAGDQRQVE